MTKKRMVILGAGISGLTAAWYFLKQNPDWDCLVLEQSQKAGGYIETEDKEGAILEKGPHIFKTSRNQEFLQLVKEIGFFEELLSSNKKSHTRYLLEDGSLHKIPGSFLFSILASLSREWRVPVKREDETIFAFGSRRFGRKVTESLIDAITLGVYGGNYKELSIEACFPILKKLEREKGSVLLGLLSSLFYKKPKGLFPGSSLFSFQGGAGAFIKELVVKMPCPILYGEKVVSLQKQENLFSISTEKNTFMADEVIIALPAYVAGSLLAPFSKELAADLESIPYTSITSANVLFNQDVGLPPGFGYLVPQKEKESILGVLFDSNIFPSQGVSSRVTILLDGASSEEDVSKCIQRALRTHLQILEEPSSISWKKMTYAIPQPRVHHIEKIKSIREKLPDHIHLIGNYLEGVSVNDCISLAKKTALAIK